MSAIKYLIVGSSHAGLSAMEAIRTKDSDGSIVLLTQEEHLPYSPTILPYVVSGDVDAARVTLVDEAALNACNVRLRKGAKVVEVSPASRTVTLQSGEELGYERLLLAAGAEPTLPHIPGLRETPHYVLRTLDDAIRLHGAARESESAVLVGAGLIGMHLAEGLRRVGLRVSLVEALPHVLPAYFDSEAAGLIQDVFRQNNVNVFTGSPIAGVSASKGCCIVSLASGTELSGEMLVVCAGVKSRTQFLAHSGVEVDEGVVVTDTMRTSIERIWAAGDVSQAKSFFDGRKRVHATLPSAVEQGRLAGMDMAQDETLSPYPGGIAMNTYRCFGRRSFCVGLTDDSQVAQDTEVDRVFLPASEQYQKLVYRGDRLVGASCINSPMDPGVMVQIIRRGIDLGAMRKQLSSSPLETGRSLMAGIWG